MGVLRLYPMVWLSSFVLFLGADVHITHTSNTTSFFASQSFEVVKKTRHFSSSGRKSCLGIST
jgi:hypothetical protein